VTISREAIRASQLYEQVKATYSCHDHRHAAAILTLEYPLLFAEICEVLLEFRLTPEQIKAPGGNESAIPKTFASLLRPKGWEERRLNARMVVDELTVSQDTHHIDFVKDCVALDLEWNSKDQTFDRDLYAFRAFFEYQKIAAAILVTRDSSLEEVFKQYGSYVDPSTGRTRKYSEKYGASTTHMSKLLPRLQAGRSGGSPVLAIGITERQIGHD
jgi:hypothetical protein